MHVSSYLTQISASETKHPLPVSEIGQMKLIGSCIFVRAGLVQRLITSDFTPTIDNVIGHYKPLVGSVRTKGI